jgi:hypothetical protein
MQKRLEQCRLEKENLPVDLPVGERILSFLVVPVHDCGYVNLYARDVTEQRHLQKAAEEGKRTLDALMEYIPEGVTIARSPNVSTLRMSRYAEKRLLHGKRALEGLFLECYTGVAGELRWLHGLC